MANNNNMEVIIDASNTSDDEIQVEAVVGGDTRDPQNNTTDTTVDDGAGLPAEQLSVEELPGLQSQHQDQSSQEELPPFGPFSYTQGNAAQGATPRQVSWKRPLVDHASEVQLLKLQILKNKQRRNNLQRKKSIYSKIFRMTLACNLTTIPE